MTMKKSSVKEILEKEGTLIYPIKGTSMLPLLHEGKDQVHLKKMDEYNLYDVVLFQTTKTSYILHRIIGKKDDKFAIIGDNSFRVDWKTKEEILGKMVGFYQGTNYVDINDEFYQNYLNERVLNKEDDYEKMMLDSEAYFYDRFKSAYYEIVRLGIDPSYQLDANKINKLGVAENLRLLNTLATKKAEHILGYAVNKCGVDLGEKLNKYVVNSLEISKIRYMRIEAAKEAISLAFDKENIKHMYLKGAVVRDIYKVPYFRWSNDIDLYVDAADLSKARDVFLNTLKCSFFAECEHHLVFESEEYKMHFELHHMLDNALPKDLQHLLTNPFEDATQDAVHPCLYHQNHAKFYLFHIVHMVKHIASGEFWVPMMMDTYLLRNRYKDATNYIKEARLETFDVAFNHIVDSLFDNSIALTKEEKDLEEFLFRDSSEIYSVVAKGSKKNKVSYFFARVFPKYKSMKFIYPVLQKAPVLLPFCYVARVFTCAFNREKFKRGVSQMNSFNEAKQGEISITDNVGLHEYLIDIRK